MLLVVLSCVTLCMCDLCDCACVMMCSCDRAMCDFACCVDSLPGVNCAFGDECMYMYDCVPCVMVYFV